MPRIRTALADRPLFVPKWLARIQPINPAMRCAGDPVYPPSRLTARVVSSGQCPEASGTIVDRRGEAERRLEAERTARKEARTREQEEGGWDRMVAMLDAKTERRAAREARRIMNRRRAACRAAFGREEIDG